MKKILFSFIFLLPLFLFLPKVSADTYNITLVEGWDSIFTTANSYNPSKTIYESLYTLGTSGTSNGDNYFIYCNYTFGSCQIRYIKNEYFSTINNYLSLYDILFNDGTHGIDMGFSSTSVYVSKRINDYKTNFYSGTCSSSICPQWDGTFLYPSSSSNLKYIIYSTFNIPIDSTLSGNTYIFSDSSGWSYTLTTPSTLPTLKNLYDIKISTPPTPEDETPLLTSFYTLAIDRISYLLEEFSSNYLYLSIFCIFLFVLIFYFIHRRLKL